MKKFSIIR